MARARPGLERMPLWCGCALRFVRGVRVWLDPCELHARFIDGVLAEHDVERARARRRLRPVPGRILGGRS